MKTRNRAIVLVRAVPGQWTCLCVGKTGEACFALLTPSEARRIAAMLLRCADKAEKRGRK